MNDTKLIGSLAAAGALLGIGQLLASGDRLTWRIAAGRAIVSGGLGVAAGSAHAYLPELSLTATIGLACLLVSLGTSGIERLFQRFIGGKGGK